MPWYRRLPTTAFFLSLLLMNPLSGRAQSSAQIPSSTAGFPSNPQASQAGEERPASWRLIVPNILHDQIPVWTFPAKLAKGHDWKPTFAVVGATAGLVALDPSDTPYFRRTNSFHRFNNVFSGTTTGVGTAVVPLSFYAVSLLRKDTYGQHTALLAGEAVADAEILDTVFWGRGPSPSPV